jgi:cation diffusion facilitator family transporter
MASGSKKVIYAALIGNGLISITKFIAASITGSSAMVSEGIHSLVDTGNQMLLLLGLRKAKKPASANFPFGHGKEVYFWSFIVAILIFALGSGISIYEGVHHIIHPAELSDPTINYIVLILAFIFEGFALYFAVKEFNKARGKVRTLKAVADGKDPTLFVVLFEDTAAMCGLVVAFIGILLAQVTGNAVWDGVASVAIGLILGGTAIWLARETKGLLIGEAADPVIVSSITQFLTAHPSVDHVNEVLTLHMGPEFILVTISADFKDTLSVRQMEQDIHAIVRQIKTDHPLVKRVFIEAEDKDAPMPAANAV